jgi:hypothetical protein
VKYDSKVWDSLPDAKINKADADFFEKYLFQAQKTDTNTKFVVKHPTSIYSGGHFNDVVYNNPANTVLSKQWGKFADADGNIDIQGLYRNLEDISGGKQVVSPGKKNDFWRVINISPEHVKKNGLWLMGGKGGSAVTEGAVMWVTKVEPNGNTLTFMVDKHNHLENNLLLGPALKKALPNDVIAISPPMPGNIKNLRVIRDKGKSRMRAEENFQQTQGPKWKDPTKSGLLDTYANVAPSARNVRGEQLKLAGKGLMAGGLLGASEN